MLSDQFVEIMNICEDNKIKVSYEQLALLSRIDQNTIRQMLFEIDNCSDLRKNYYLKIMFTKEYIMHPYYFEILDLILDVKEEYLQEFIDLLTIPKITKLPYFYDYINIFFIITSTRDGIDDYHIRHAILELIPEADGVYSREFMKILLREKIEDEYENLIKSKAVISFEDESEETSALIEEIETRYAFFRKTTRINPMKLERKKPHSNIIKINFREEE